jgi:hypothetical protein
MHTLEELRSGKLAGIKKLKLSCGLTTVPEEVFELVDNLEILDLTGNNLSDLPKKFGLFKKLKIAFFSNNQFTHLPEVLSECSNLDIIGFKANKISSISENALPANIRWLILTDNALTKLPESIGTCRNLQKVMLAGNKLEALPSSMAACKNLELLRISANRFNQIPAWLFALPKLSWLAFAGNPCSNPHDVPDNLELIDWQDLEIDELLGEGASGIISKAHLKKQEMNAMQVAVKVFKGYVTSDGLPENEMNACIAAGTHPNLVQVLGKIKNHPEQRQGLLLELIPPVYTNLGGPPDFKTCTRDTFPDDLTFSFNEILSIVKGIASAVYQLHSKGIMHGDLYAHNILINKKGENDLHPIFGDFGAATFYDQTSPDARFIERMEVRAFGCLLEDLLDRVKKEDPNGSNYQLLNQLKNLCLDQDTSQRPGFKNILTTLESIK